MLRKSYAREPPRLRLCFRKWRGRITFRFRRGGNPKNDPAFAAGRPASLPRSGASRPPARPELPRGARTGRDGRSGRAVRCQSRQHLPATLPDRRPTRRDRTPWKRPRSQPGWRLPGAFGVIVSAVAPGRFASRAGRKARLLPGRPTGPTRSMIQDQSSRGGGAHHAKAHVPVPVPRVPPVAVRRAQVPGPVPEAAAAQHAHPAAGSAPRIRRVSWPVARIPIGNPLPRVPAHVAQVEALGWKRADRRQLWKAVIAGLAPPSRKYSFGRRSWPSHAPPSHTSSFPHGYRRPSAPARAANSHSASVGSRPPSQVANAYASCQVTFTTGSRSFSPIFGPSAVRPARQARGELPEVGVGDLVLHHPEVRDGHPMSGLLIVIGARLTFRASHRERVAGDPAPVLRAVARREARLGIAEVVSQTTHQ